MIDIETQPSAKVHDGMSELVEAKQRQHAGHESLLNIIATAARDPATDVAKFEALFRLQREIIADEAKLQFIRAMAAVQEEMEPIRRDAKNEQTRSKYARLETIDATARPIYTKHGFSLSFNSRPVDPPNVHVECEVAHSAGHAKIYSLEAALDVSGAQGKTNKTPMHGLGSTVSYLRRYLTGMIFNLVLVSDDDDGNAAGRSYERDPPAYDRAPQSYDRVPAPPPMPQPVKLTVRDWLASAQRDLDKVTDAEALAELLRRPDMVSARATLTAWPMTELVAMITTAEERVKATPSSAAPPKPSTTAATSAKHAFRDAGTTKDIPPQDPLDILRDRLARCTSHDDVVKVEAAWSAGLVKAKNSGQARSEETMDKAIAMLNAAYGQFKPAFVPPEPHNEEDHVDGDVERTEQNPESKEPVKRTSRRD